MCFYYSFPKIYLSRVFQHFGVLRNEAYADAGPVHFRRTTGVREDRWTSQRGTLDFLYACVPGGREILTLGV